LLFGKIGLIASKDHRLQKIPSKLCRSVKYHRKSATSPGYSVAHIAVSLPGPVRLWALPTCVARSRLPSWPLLPLAGAVASPRLPLPGSRHRQRAEEDQPREPQQRHHLVDGGPSASSGPGPPNLGSPRCGPTNKPGRRLSSLTPVASRGGGGEAYRTP
jgi:hypothetical protein